MRRNKSCQAAEMETLLKTPTATRANTIIAAIHISPCGLTYIVCERLACESLPMICWQNTLTGIQNF